MIAREIIKRGTYRDSVTLMKISTEISALKGVFQAVVVMGTELNKKLLEESGLLSDQA